MCQTYYYCTIMLIVSYIILATWQACGSYLKLWVLLLQLFPFSVIVPDSDCDCFLLGIDQSVGGALTSKENLAHTLFSDPAICMSCVLFCLLCSPSATQPSNVPVICREKTIIFLSDRGYRVIPPHSIESTCLSFIQTVTRYLHGCFFPLKMQCRG